MHQYKAIFLNDNALKDQTIDASGRNASESVTHRVYSDTIIAQLHDKIDLADPVYTSEDLKKNPVCFEQVEVVFSTWGMAMMTEEEIHACLPSLKYVFYAAGSVQYFAQPYLNCGVRVFSAWGANAIPVAEVTAAEIILANKGFFPKMLLTTANHRAEARALTGYPGNFDVFVGIIGAGMIGRKVIELLKPYRLKIRVFDPFLSDEKAKELGVEKTDLFTLFSTCQVVSNHLANNPQTVGMLNYECFSRMLPYASFLNTARGAQVVEADLVRTLQERPDLTAILDVTFPEPPEPSHAFYSLKNCLLTPHLAGSSGVEVYRMAEYMAEQFENILEGRPVSYEVFPEMLATMA